MSEDSDGDATPGSAGDGAGRRAYNRPRRYPVPAPASPAAATSPGTSPADEITRQNPTLADAAEQYHRRSTDGPGPVDPGPAAPTGQGGMPPPGRPGGGERGPDGPPSGPFPIDPGRAAGYTPAPSGARRRPSNRALLVVVAVIVVVAVAVGLAIGLSGGDDGSSPQDGAGPGAGSTPASTATTARTSSAPVSAAPSTTAGVPASGSSASTRVCASFRVTVPFTSLVAQTHPTPRMPDSYVEPESGTRVGICIGYFRPAAGQGRGRIAYLAQYERLPATEYALTLKTLGWKLVANLPRPTYRNNFDTTVTLVQQGSALVTVVGTGR
ncbi:hypothetical protein [uncultured Jatrophihabitans sp.]|uniref:hypothetical protein n=1 Tax=uncultured Jatrophihabitans sp. TaxID=1610747 RepID=UPI0035CC6051